MDNTKMNPEMNLSKEELESIYFSEITPESITPMFEAQRSKDYIPFINEDMEQWPDMLIDLMNNSALHGAIVKSKIDQVSGKGFTWDVSAEGSDMLAAWAGNINSEGEDLNEVLWKVSTDFEIHNGFALLVNWSKDWTTVISIEHVDFSKIRANKVCEKTGKVLSYWYSWDWTKQRAGKVNIPVFNMGTAKTNKDAYQQAVEKGNNEELQEMFLKPTTQIYYYKPYTPGEFYYPLPSYNGALSAIKTDILSDGYGLGTFENGLNASMIVTFFNLMTPQSRNSAVKKFKAMHEGSRGKRTIYHFANKAEDALKVDKLDSNKADGVYTSVNENTLQKILSAHRITDPIIVGISTAGGFGDAEKIKAAINFWEATVIIPEQLEITKVFNKIMSINQFPDVWIDPLDLMPEEDSIVDEEVNSEVNTEPEPETIV